MPAAGLEAFGIQEIAQHPAAREGKLEMQRVHASHHGEFGQRHGTRQEIDALTAEFQRMPHDRQVVLLVDHRFALSMPTLACQLASYLETFRVIDARQAEENPPA